MTLSRGSKILSGMAMAWALAFFGQSAEGADSAPLPSDRVPTRIGSSNGRFFVAYQYRIVFGVVPLGASTSPANVASLSPSKELKFANPISVSQSSEPLRLLVCTIPHSSYYIAADKAERRLLGGGRVPWQNPNADYGDFCGVIGLSGEEIFKFPFSQRRHNNLLEPLTLSGDGNYAAVMVGEEIPGEDGPSVGKWREILTWEYPATFKKHPGPWKSGSPPDGLKAIQDVRRKFGEKPRPK